MIIECMISVNEEVQFSSRGDENVFICLMEYGLGATYHMVSSCSFI